MNVEGPTRRSLGTAQFGIDDDSNRIMPTYPSVQASHMGTMNKPLRNYICKSVCSNFAPNRS
ncbi:Uncharacterized protein BM_BM1423 [Brugia malayi]|uniref:Bm1423 n=2 Tax=Brugia malayi TaxID=6279 RepID=A0A0H5SME9_BRUMA|nr:Uncharacterized protein BM_BM1423 [Brugia malayi]CRZ24892.1 Bm1423 [Brugia malayi]VIO93971.1 Uncharacterized protein BM_BM1423 [Brugia malayi]